MMLEDPPFVHRGLLKINPDVLLMLGMQDGIRTVGSPIPRNARVINRALDERGDIVLLVEGEGLPKVLEGAQYPWLDPIKFKAPDSPYSSGDDPGHVTAENFAECYDADAARDPRMPPRSDACADDRLFPWLTPELVEGITERRITRENFWEIVESSKATTPGGRSCPDRHGDIDRAVPFRVS